MDTLLLIALSCRDLPKNCSPFCAFQRSEGDAEGNHMGPYNYMGQTEKQAGPDCAFTRLVEARISMTTDGLLSTNKVQYHQELEMLCLLSLAIHEHVKFLQVQIRFTVYSTDRKPREVDGELLYEMRDKEVEANENYNLAVSMDFPVNICGPFHIALQVLGGVDVDLLQFLERSRDIGFVEYHLPNKKKQTSSLVIFSLSY